MVTARGIGFALWALLALILFAILVWYGPVTAQEMTVQDPSCDSQLRVVNVARFNAESLAASLIDKVKTKDGEIAKLKAEIESLTKKPLPEPEKGKK